MRLLPPGTRRVRTRGVGPLGGIAVVAATAVACAAPPENHTPLQVRDAWVRAADSGATGAAYLTLANGDTVDIAITGWSSSAAVAAELHETMQHQGMVHMSARPAIVIARDSTLTMIPGGLHVMLIELRRALVVGDTVSLIATFADGRTLDVRAPVRAP
ncbi:MAG: copper chaperone PCu(A)C [Gemmatimonadaceae bacterium]|nr:copper chaperone PCu(A)C [Gemmatimonadaceae bacterium]MCC6432691.1 copper chaperone PCu(A)C [Gemmatimonadaceae bacterium]